MIGLEYVLKLFNMQALELADFLGIKKQNINMWIKGKQNISKKHLPALEKKFGVKAELLKKELDEIDKLEIQKIKLEQEIKPEIVKFENTLLLDEDISIKKEPVYDNDKINEINQTIEKADLVLKFKEMLDSVDKNPYMDYFNLIIAIMNNAGTESLTHKTLIALAHYFEVLPAEISTDEEQAEFEAEIFEIFDDNNFKIGSG